ncbi:uncharacterized protein [Paramisgurnus dabryanus]|uniref:uncharacterized protein n=1 Tax=Paramisgurnus dabryanus TaxID=90735 RepID=UPI003CCF5ACE
MEGDSVTLHTDITEIQKDDLILWRFGLQKSLIERINGAPSETLINDDVLDGRFRDRLMVNDQTGDLTIKDTKTKDSGLYEMIINSAKESSYRFNVTVYAFLPVPVITRDSSQCSSSSSSSNCVLLCSVMNVRDVSLSWYKGNSLLSSISVTYLNFKLSLHLEVEYQDINTYRCVVNNAIKNRTEHLNIDELCQPCSGCVCCCHDFEAVIRLVLSALVGVAAFAILVYDIRSSILSPLVPTYVLVPQDTCPILSMDNPSRVVQIAGSVISTSPMQQIRTKATTIRHPTAQQIRIMTPEVLKKMFLMCVYLCLCFCGLTGVFGDEVKSVSVLVTEGDSVTLHTDIKLQRDDLILWRFGLQNTIIARINGEAKEISIYDNVLDGRFRDRLQVNNQTGDLTITNITTQHSGVYNVTISGKQIISYRVNVTVYGCVFCCHASEVVIRLVVSALVGVAAVAILVYDIRSSRVEQKKRSQTPSDYFKIKDLSSMTNLISVFAGVFGDEVKSVSVMEGDSVTLHTDLTELQEDEMILWRYACGRFTNKLQIWDSKTGDLTIMNMMIKNSGLYEAEINLDTETIYKRFNVTVIGVFGDEVKSVSVMEGDSVTLHTDITEIQRDHVINWRFDGVRIAQINKAASMVLLNDDVLDGRFKARLDLNSQTGDLTITNITTKDSGVYKLQISDSSKSIEKIFNVTGLFGHKDKGKSVSVMEEDSVTLNTDVPDIKTYNVIRWRFQHENSPLAELDSNAGFFFTYDDVHNGRFKGRLQLDHQTGSLIITNIRNTDSGLYKVDISISNYTIHQSFTVNVRGGVKSVSVMIGDSVTLYTDADIHTYDFIEWMFGDKRSRIAQINKPDARFVTYDGDDGRFRDRLNLNDQTGSLTIRNTRTEHRGVYEVKISSKRHSLHRRFILTVTAMGLSLVTVAQVCGAFLLIIVVAVAVFWYCFRSHGRVPNLAVIDKEMEVMEGGSVTLHNDLTQILSETHIIWSFGFKEVTIAKIKKTGSKCVDERFKDKLTLNQQTGDITINDISNEQSGLYHLDITKRKKLLSKTFNVIVICKEITVNAGESVTLKTSVTEIQKDEKIEWMFGNKDTVIAQNSTLNSTYDGDNGIFKDKLELNHQTGDLTISDIRQRHAGVYTLKTVINGNVSFMRLRVTVTDMPAQHCNELKPLIKSETSSSGDVS